MIMEQTFICHGTTYQVKTTLQNGNLTLKSEDGEREFSVIRVSDQEWILRVGDKQTRIFSAVDKSGTRYIHCRGETYILTPAEEDFSTDADSASNDGRLMALMPGKVIRIMVEKGQSVKKGQPVLILESMKMENTQESPFDGKVVEINAEEGQQVDAGAVIVRLEAQSAD